MREYIHPRPLIKTVTLGLASADAARSALETARQYSRATELRVFGYDPSQPRDHTGKWTSAGASAAQHSEGAAHHASRREEAKADKNHQAAARHHATQLAHEAAAHIKNGDHAAAAEKLDQLKKGISALHVQTRYAIHNKLGDAEVAERDGATKHYQALQAGLRKVMKGGEMPAVTHYRPGLAASGQKGQAAAMTNSTVLPNEHDLAHQKANAATHDLIAQKADEAPKQNGAGYEPGHVQIFQNTANDHHYKAQQLQQQKDNLDPHAQPHNHTELAHAIKGHQHLAAAYTKAAKGEYAGADLEAALNHAKSAKNYNVTNKLGNALLISAIQAGKKEIGDYAPESLTDPNPPKLIKLPNGHTTVAAEAKPHGNALLGAVLAANGTPSQKVAGLQDASFGENKGHAYGEGYHADVNDLRTRLEGLKEHGATPERHKGIAAAAAKLANHPATSAENKAALATLAKEHQAKARAAQPPAKSPERAKAAAPSAERKPAQTNEGHFAQMQKRLKEVGFGPERAIYSPLSNAHARLAQGDPAGAHKFLALIKHPEQLPNDAKEAYAAAVKESGYTPGAAPASSPKTATTPHTNTPHSGYGDGDGSAGAAALGEGVFGSDGKAKPQTYFMNTADRKKEVQAALEAHKGHWKVEGGKASVTLPDGSKMTIHHHSASSYKTNSSGKIKIGPTIGTHQLTVAVHHPDGTKQIEIVREHKTSENDKVGSDKKNDGLYRYVRDKLGIDPIAFQMAHSYGASDPSQEPASHAMRHANFANRADTPQQDKNIHAGLALAHQALVNKDIKGAKEHLARLIKEHGTEALAGYHFKDSVAVLNKHLGKA